MNITLPQFLTPAQISKAERIWRKNLTPAKQICKEVIEPNIEEINRKLGQDNIPLYLAYACEHVFNSTLKR